MAFSMAGPALGQPSGGAPGQPTILPTKPPASRPQPGRPPGVRPPYSSPNPWRRPTSSSWYWHGRWHSRVTGARFVYPPGYAYRRWHRGERIPAVFLAPPYFYASVALAGLSAAPPGYRWVRYGTDLLLVDMATGRVEDVAYGVFF
jgi:Ni/Co efflux regulator RcnB